eukprot:9254895-Prorocentrum_lima.AAC.1
MAGGPDVTRCRYEAARKDAHGNVSGSNPAPDQMQATTGQEHPANHHPVSNQTTTEPDALVPKLDIHAHW